MSTQTVTFDLLKYETGLFELVCRDGTKPLDLHSFAGPDDQRVIAVQHHNGLVLGHRRDGTRYGFAQVSAKDLFLTPKPRKVFVNIYEDGCDTREEAEFRYQRGRDFSRSRDRRTPDRIACVEVTVTPGQGI